MSDYVSILLEGCDGSSWDLISGEQGALLGVKPTGFYDMPMKTYWVPYAFGQQYQSKQAQRRDMVFTVQIGTDTNDPDEWHQIESRWRMAWDYLNESTLVVTTSDGKRTLGVRLLEEPKAAQTAQWEGYDPHCYAQSTYVMTVAAEIPYYIGDLTTTDMTFPAGAGSTQVIDVYNPTDSEMWLEWVLSAPGTWTLPDFSWGQNIYGRAAQDAERTWTLPDLQAGENVSVTSRPDVEPIVSQSGSLVQARTNGQCLMYPVAPHTGGAVPVSWQPDSGDTTSVGYAQLIQQQWHSRPWGSVR
ncbi:hypothetical protein [Tsukamurella soli]|uniref:Phage tail protein n=1 Tax=Tsukamurella soli TaxID=644556 RepID=A0ABP8K2U3_9ACTN